jgi:phage terminase large subunit-like protein
LNNLILPDYRSKQKILYIDKVNQNALQKHGDSFLEEGRLFDALDFYQKAGFNSGLQKMKDIAFDSGDVMLFQQAAKALNLELNTADWDAIGQKAMGLKKYYFARHAFQKANNEEMLNSLNKIIQQEVEVKSA